MAGREARIRATRENRKLPVIAGKIPPSEPRTSPEGGLRMNSMLMEPAPLEKMKKNRNNMIEKTKIVEKSDQNRVRLIENFIVCVPHP